jgi:CBS-domain-containing membrane protein
MRFSEWLESNTAEDVLLAKTPNSDDFASISTEDTIWKAMWDLGSHDISAVTVYSKGTGGDDVKTYSYILTINDILNYVKSFLDRCSADDLKCSEWIKKECLDHPISKLIESVGPETARLKPVFVQPDTTVAKLIEIWVEEQAYSASHRVLVGCEDSVHDVLTMTDLIHYCFVNSHQLSDVMQAHALSALYPGTKTPTPFSSNSLIDETESAWSALQKLLDASPVQVVGVTDPCNGNLIGYLSSRDFMPSAHSDQIFCIIKNLHKSVAQFVRSTSSSPSRLIDAVTFRDNMNLEQLIERLLKLRVHMLWRIAFTGQVIGMVTAIDVLRYFKRCSDLGC